MRRGGQRPERVSNVPVLHQLDVGKHIASLDGENAGAVERASGVSGDGWAQEGRDTVCHRDRYRRQSHGVSSVLAWCVFCSCVW